MEAGEGVSFTVFFLLSVVYIMFDFNYIFVIFFCGGIFTYVCEHCLPLE